MELQFTIRTDWTNYQIGATVPDKFFTYATYNILPLVEMANNPDLLDVTTLTAPGFIQYGIRDHVISCTPSLTGDLSLLFYEDAIYLRAEFSDGEVRDSSNWYGYDGEQGDEGPGDEDNEESDEDDDTVSEE